MHSRVPALGPRGEGWVILQLLLFALIGAGGWLALADHDAGNPWGAGALVLGAVAIAAGGLVAVLGAWQLRAALSPFPRPIAGSGLVQSGVYRRIRHPIYSGLVLAAIGWSLVTASPVAAAGAVLLFVLFVGKSHREEVWLAVEHPDYAAYQARTKRLIPWVY